MEFNLILIGIICFAFEAILPGFGMFGFLGITAFLGAVFFILGADAMAAVIVAGITLLLILLGYLFIKYLPNSWLGRNLLLKWRSTSDRGYTSVDVQTNLEGKTGVAKTVLRPAGIVIIDDKLIDAVTEGSFLEAGTAVKVISVTGGRVLVREV